MKSAHDGAYLHLPGEIGKNQGLPLPLGEVTVKHSPAHYQFIPGPIDGLKNIIINATVNMVGDPLCILVQLTLQQMSFSELGHQPIDRFILNFDTPSPPYLSERLY